MFKHYFLLHFSICLFLLEFDCLSQNKLSPHLKNGSTKIEETKTLLSITTINVRKFESDYKDKVIIKYRHDASNSFEILLLEKDLLSKFEKDPNILFIDAHNKAKVEADFDYANSAFNRISKLHHFNPELTGSSSKISIKELSFDPTNIDIINRSFTTTVTPASTAQHATNMAILIAGAGNSFYKTKGVASNASITASDFGNLFPDSPTIFKVNNINIQNHSYGVAIENYYGNEAVAYDQQIYQNPTQLHVFSAGNSGKLKPASGTYQNMLFANITGNFKQAKNVLIVNAVDTTLSINSLNSRGPAFDGRLKPELTAYGSGGTSDAAALVSGISTLVHEKYQSVNQKIPDASLTKAILIASADDINAIGIDYLSGYGSVNAYKAVRLVQGNQYLNVDVSSNTQQSISISVPTGVRELKVVIVWSDPAAVVNSNTILVNDIDSWINSSVGKTLPWVLSTFPKPDSLMAPAKRKEDHLNNVEYITISNPLQETVTLTLKAGNLIGGTQKVSVAYWFNQNQIFSWDFPHASDILEGNKKNLLVWEAPQNKVGDLFVQYNQGSWLPVQSNIDLNNYLYWKCPDTLATAKLKMVVDAQEFLTDESMISPLIKMKTAFNCPDKIGLTWDKVKGTSGYDIYSMGNQYITKISSTTDTLISFLPNTNLFYSVTPLLGVKAGLKSELINYTLQGSFCYVNFFTATRASASEIKIDLSLSSWFDVDHINITKTARGISSLLKKLLPSNSLTIELVDSELIPEVMSYQAEVVFKNGTKIISDKVNIVLEPKGKALLFPNPVTSNDDLTILSAGDDSKFRITDLLGRLVYEKELKEIQEPIDVLNLPTGFYLYQLISSSGSVNDSGRFIKK